MNWIGSRANHKEANNIPSFYIFNFTFYILLQESLPLNLLMRQCINSLIH